MAQFDQGGGCACGTNKHCNCDYATAEDLRSNLPKINITKGTNIHSCQLCNKAWFSGEKPPCSKCNLLWDRIDKLEGKDNHRFGQILKRCYSCYRNMPLTSDIFCSQQCRIHSLKLEVLPEDEVDITKEIKGVLTN